MRALLLLPLVVACGGAADVPVAEAAPAEPAEAAGAEAPAVDPDSDTPAADRVLAEAEVRHFGGPFTVEETVAFASLAEDPSAYVDRTVKVEGRVADVCQKAGCWMVLAEGDKTMRVTMKDHSFSVAKDGAGSSCVVQGTLVSKAVDPETVAHLEGESEKPELMPEKQAEEGVIYELQATGVALRPAS